MTDENWLTRFMVTKKCRNCGKVFDIRDRDDWAYKIGAADDNIFFCSWHCIQEYRQKRNGRKGKSRPVALINEEGEILKTYASIKAAARDNGIGESGIVRVVDGLQEDTKGLRFKKL